MAVQSFRVESEKGENAMTEGLFIDRDRIGDFSRRWSISEFALFGSILRADFGPDSDVDVLVTFAPDALWTLWDLSRMRFELEAIFGREVDLVEKKALRNPYRRQAIFADHRVLYAS
jgi:predicted nucleotidyltransferase